MIDTCLQNIDLLQTFWNEWKHYFQTIMSYGQSATVLLLHIFEFAIIGHWHAIEEVESN